MTQILVNLKSRMGKARRETRGGREYLVATVTSIVPGVLDGSGGKGYYPADETRNSASRWNGMPLVLYHPSRNGKPVSARDPDVLESYGLGHVYSTKFTDNRLRHEAWFDVEALKRISNDLLLRLEKGEKLEVSTGLSVAKEPAPDKAVHNSPNGPKEYDWIARDYQPDHLAILPDQVGACSVTDGCGVFNQLSDSLGDVPALIVNSTDVPAEEQRKSLWRKLGEMLGILNQQPSHSDLKEQLSKLVSARFEKRDPMGYRTEYCYVEDVYDKKVIFRKGDKLMSLGYTTDLRTSAVSLSDDEPVEVRKVTSYKPVSNTTDDVPADGGDGKEPSPTSVRTEDGKDPAGKPPLTLDKPDTTTTRNGGRTMTDKERENTINWLVTNCECWKGDGDRDTLNGLSDAKLAKLRAAAEKAQQEEVVANAARKGFTDPGGNDHVWNEKEGKWESRRKEEPKKEERDTQKTSNVSNQEQAQTAEEWLSGAPSQVQQWVLNAKERYEQDKTEVINRLSAHVTDEKEKEKLTKWLQGKELDELRNMALMLPPPQQPQQTNYRRPSFLGASTPESPRQRDDDDDILEIPTINWAEKTA